MGAHQGACGGREPLDAEVLTLLEKALRDRGLAVPDEETHRRHREALESIIRRRDAFPKGKDIPNSTELLREDRAR